MSNQQSIKKYIFDVSKSKLIPVLSGILLMPMNRKRAESSSLLEQINCEEVNVYSELSLQTIYNEIVVSKKERV